MRFGARQIGIAGMVPLQFSREKAARPFPWVTIGHPLSSVLQGAQKSSNKNVPSMFHMNRDHMGPRLGA
jgi:hypothetical protein